MNELHAILDSWRTVQETNRDAVLATVVHVKGSAYRRPGARMLILPDGRRIGSVSGGCLEGEIAKKAWWFTESLKPAVRVYDTTSDDDAVWEFGLGCNGVVHVMLERVSMPSVCEMFDFLDARRRTAAVVATVTRGPHAGERLLIDELWERGGTIIGSSIESDVMIHCAAALRKRRSRLVHLGDSEVFVEWINPQLSLVVFGAGHDAIPVVAIGKEIGWHVTVADGRPAYATRQRFGGADRIVLLPDEVHIDSETAVVMMTHNYPLDLRLLPRIVASRPRYLGILGPKSRAEKLFADLGIDPPPHVHAPVGLDIGCDTTAAVALSIVSEIQAAVSDRCGGMLRHRESPIHAPAIEFGAAPQTRLEAARPSHCETTVGSNV